MNYFKDVWGIVTLEDKVYKKVAGSKDSFKNYVIAHLTVNYIFVFFLMLLLFVLKFAFSNLIGNKDMLIIYIIVGILLVVPFLTLGLTLLFSLIPHIIGLMFGGKPKRYLDFFTVSNYAYPTFGVLLSMFGLSIVYMLWYFVILYKTYLNVHKLSKEKAMWATGVNVVVYFVFVGALVMVYFFSILSFATL